MPWIFNSVPSGKLMGGLALLCIGLFATMIWSTLPPLRTIVEGHLEPPFDLKSCGYDRSYANKYLDGLGEAGRHHYLTRQIPLDLIFPACYGTLGVSIWLWLLAKFRPPVAERILMKWVALFPIVGALLDYAENACVAMLLIAYPQGAERTVRIASFATTSKFSILGIFGILLVALMIAAIRTRRKQRASVLRPTETLGL